MEFSVNFSLNLMLLMCMKVLCVPLYAQIKGEFSLYLVGLMVSLKCMLCSPTHEKNEDGWFLWISRCFTIILGVLGLYKPSAPGLLSNALIL